MSELVQGALALVVIGLLVIALVAPAAPLRALRAASRLAGVAAVGALAAISVAPADSFTRTSLLLLVLAATLACAVLAFSVRHMRGDRHLDAYARGVVLLAAATLLGAGTDDMVVFAAAWLAASRIVVELIAQTAAPEQATRAAASARGSFRLGDAALVITVLLAALACADSGFAALANADAAAAPFLQAAAAALLVAIVVRSAALPAQRWLLASTAAPTPVCALLHAGFVNAGGIAALKFAPLLTAAPLALFALLAGGIAAILGGTAIGLVRADVKGRLAGSTVAQMGYMLVQCGLGAFAHALFHILAHGVFKAHAFLRANGEIGVAGNAASTPARGTEWLMLLPSLLFFAAWGLTDLALADLVLLSFAATLGIEALSLAWRRGCLPQGVLRALAVTIPALLAAVVVHHLLPTVVAAPLPIAPSAHLLGAMLGVLSILAYLRAARVALPDALHAALLRLANAHPPQRARLAPLPLATLRAARRSS